MIAFGNVQESIVIPHARFIPSFDSTSVHAPDCRRIDRMVRSVHPKVILGQSTWPQIRDVDDGLFHTMSLFSDEQLSACAVSDSSWAIPSSI